MTISETNSPRRRASSAATCTPAARRPPAGHQAQALAAQGHGHVNAEERDAGGLGRGVGRRQHADAAKGLDHAQGADSSGPRATDWPKAENTAR